MGDFFLVSVSHETKHETPQKIRDISEPNNFGEIQTGAHKQGLKPQIFRENRGKILPGKSGLFGPDWSLFRAYRGLFGADWDRFLRTSQLRGGSRNSPEKAFLGPIGAFWAKPPFAKPPFGFPQKFGATFRMKIRRIRGLSFGNFLT